jgi:hypothetical protein
MANVKPARSHVASSRRSSSRVFGLSAHSRAIARSPLESLVPPEFTVLKISTTSSIVRSLPLISSGWISISRTSFSRVSRSMWVRLSSALSPGIRLMIGMILPWNTSVTDTHVGSLAILEP